MSRPATALVLPRDWRSSYQTSVAQGRERKHDVQQATMESHHVASIHAKIREKTARNLEAKLDERLVDLNFWRNELDRALTELQIGSRELDSVLPVLAAETKMCQDHLELARERQYCRTLRPRKENVLDHAYTALVFESKLLEAEIRNLNFAMAETREKIRHGRKLAYLFEKLMKQRQEAEDIDLHCKELRADSANLAFIRDHLIDGERLLSTNSWVEWNRSIVQAALDHVQLMAAMKQHWQAEVERISEDRRKAQKDTEFLLESRIREVTDAKKRVMSEHAQLVDEVRRAEECIETLRNSISELEKLRSLAKSRLALRTYRPAHERTKDAVYDALHVEVFELERLIEREKELVERNEKNLIGLRRQLVILEDHVGDKGDALAAEESARFAPTPKV